MRAYCEAQLAARRSLDPRSFRWIKSGKAKLLVGCPRGSWLARKQRCKVGTRAYKKLVPADGACPRGQRRQLKRR